VGKGAACEKAWCSNYLSGAVILYLCLMAIGEKTRRKVIQLHLKSALAVKMAKKSVTPLLSRASSSSSACNNRLGRCLLGMA